MRPWIVWATGLLAYIVAVLDRTTLGVSGLAAADRFHAGPTLLSTFVVLQVVVYAGAQVPAGLLLDRFGSKVLIVVGCGADGLRASLRWRSPNPCRWRSPPARWSASGTRSRSSRCCASCRTGSRRARSRW